MADEVASLRRETRLPHHHSEYARPSGAELASLLREAGWSGGQAAQIAGVSGRRVREWIGGEREVPYSAWRLLLERASLALGIDLGIRKIADMLETLDTNLRSEELLRSGRLKVGLGPNAATAESSAPAIEKLHFDNEQVRALVDYMRAIARRSEASFGGEWEEAERDVRAARERVDQLRKSIS